MWGLLALQGDPECYARISGTSAAVPYAAGAAALIASMPNAPKTGVAIKKLLLETADRLVCSYQHSNTTNCKT